MWAKSGTGRLGPLIMPAGTVWTKPLRLLGCLSQSAPPKYGLSNAFLYHNLHIIRSIQMFLADTTRSLKLLLVLLPILKARFDRQYKCDIYIDWHEPFRTDFDLVCDLVFNKDPQGLAINLTYADEQILRSEGPILSDDSLNLLGRRWNFRSEVARECCAAYPLLCPLLKELVSVSSFAPTFYLFSLSLLTTARFYVHLETGTQQ